jgi:hypothetical protein
MGIFTNKGTVRFGLVVFTGGISHVIFIQTGSVLYSLIFLIFIFQVSLICCGNIAVTIKIGDHR